MFVVSALKGSDGPEDPSYERINSFFCETAFSGSLGLCLSSPTGKLVWWRLSTIENAICQKFLPG